MDLNTAKLTKKKQSWRLKIEFSDVFMFFDLLGSEVRFEHCKNKLKTMKVILKPKNCTLKTLFKCFDLNFKSYRMRLDFLNSVNNINNET